MTFVCFLPPNLSGASDPEPFGSSFIRFELRHFVLLRLSWMQLYRAGMVLEFDLSSCKLLKRFKRLKQFEQFKRLKQLEPFKRFAPLPFLDVLRAR